MTTTVDLRRVDLANSQWKSYRLGSTFPWATSGNPNDPTLNAGSAPVGTASYAVPSSNTLFVSPSGSDSNPGDLASPKLTLQGAMGAATNSTTIVMRAGTYNEGADTQSGGTSSDSRGEMVAQIGGLFNTTKTGITIQNYPGEAVWIDGSVQFDTNWTKDATSGLWWHTYDRRMDRSHTQSPGASDNGSGGAASGGYWVSSALNNAASYPDMILRDGVELQVVDSETAVTSGKVFIDGSYLSSPHSLWYQGTKVWVADDPTGHEMRYSNKTMLLQWNVGPLTIRGIGIRRYACFQSGQGAMYVQAGDVTFENVWLEHFSALVINSVGGNANRTYRNVTCLYAGYGFLQDGGHDNVIVDSCHFQYNNYRNFNPGGPALAIIKCGAMQGITVKNSRFLDSNCSGFWTDRTVNLPQVYNCRFQNLVGPNSNFLGNAARAVDLEGASNGLVANCLIANVAGYGIWQNDSSACKYYNNTVVDTHRQGVSSDSHSAGGGPFTIGQSNRRPWETSSNFSIDYQWMKDSRQASSYYDNPDHQWACRNFWLYNNVLCVSAGATGIQSMFSCQSGADNSIANPSIGGAGDGVRGFSAFVGSGGMDSNVWWTESQLPYGYFITTNGYNVSASIYTMSPNSSNSLVGFHSATSLEANGTQRPMNTSGNPLNSRYQVIDTTLHSKATALPSDIAALIGQLPGTKRAGCFLVG